VRAAFGNLAVFDKQNSVAKASGRKAVRDEKRYFAARHLVIF
jgi:hypothetical protein